MSVDPILSHLIGLIQQWQGHPLAPLFFGLTYGAACFVMPVSFFPVAGGILFGFWGGMTMNMLAALAGASGPFFVARRWGRDRAELLLKKWTSPRIRRFLENPTPWAFILLRLVGFPPFVVTNYLAGLSRLRWRTFFWTSAVGILPWTLLLTFFSHGLWVVLLTAGTQGFRRAILAHSRPLIFTAFLSASVGGTILFLRLFSRSSVKRESEDED